MSETHESRANPLVNAVRRWRVHQCHAALVGGRLQADYLVRLGYEAGKIEAGYDAVDNAHFEQSVSPTSASHAFPEERYFFANSRFIKRKGIDAFLRAYAEYRRLHAARGCAGSPWPVVISGSGEMESRWKDLSTSLGISSFVHWPGFLSYDALPLVYQRAGAFVHPARHEAWGLVVNEAAAAGLPLIVGRRVGAAAELLRDCENGFLVDPDDTAFVASCLLRVALLSHSERTAMGAASKRLVSLFGPSRFGHGLVRCVGL